MTQSKLTFLVALTPLFLSACSDDLGELQQKVAEIKSRPGERVEPLPEIKPYESYTYNAATLRSPFVPSAPARVPRAVPARQHAHGRHAGAAGQELRPGAGQGRTGPSSPARRVHRPE